MQAPCDVPYFLAYELADNPGYEYEVAVSGVTGAKAELSGKSDMLVWAYLYDEAGEVVADKEMLV